MPSPASAPRPRAAPEASADGAPLGHRAGSPELRRASLAVFLAGLAVFAMLYEPQVLLPELTRAFGVSPGAATLAVSVATAGLALGLLVLGPVSDRRGRTVILRASLVSSVVLAALLAVVPSWELLLVVRALQGFALAGLPAVGVAYLREELHPSVSARAIGLFIGGTAIGGLSGRVLGGFLADAGGWRATMGGIAALAAVCAVAVWVLLPPSRRFRPVPRTGRLVRQLAAAFTDPVLLGLYAVAALLMGGFVAVYNAATFRLEAPPYALAPSVAGLVFLAYLLGSVSSPVAGALAARWTPRRVVPAAAVVMLGGVLLTLAAPLALFVLGLCVLTTGFFAAHGVASSWVAARAAYGERAVGQAASLYSFWYYVGSSVGGTVAGRAWATGGWPAVVWLAGGTSAAAVVLTAVLGRTRALAPPDRS
ncbi:MFS transporter [Trujillonella endophytica]|uniref:MFS transporter, YNFM family, putative membrane transport protein n=1 Tax=Trujillonella endophytica TaxID=673521 RepID=A0A1H8TVB1_9ACTN|nr:MFS transporter [Trujillella endophytica]SEO94847.1 MFS transporter, YNFM family, putative membrane transport protein [Trujillella endophytica]